MTIAELVTLIQQKQQEYNTYVQQAQQLLGMVDPADWDAYLKAVQAGTVIPPNQSIDPNTGKVVDAYQAGGAPPADTSSTTTLPNGQNWTANAPPTPSWLPKYVPGLVSGQTITPQNPALASGQLWGKTPYTKREMLGGYIDYAGTASHYPTQTDYEESVAANIPVKTAQAAWRPIQKRF